MKIAIFLLIFITSCTTTTQHGIFIKEKDIKAIQPKITRMEDVKTLLGTPSFIWKEQWYYISTLTKQKAFLTPRVIEHNAYRISFQGKTVIKIEHFTKKDIISTRIKKEKIELTKPDLTQMFE